MASILRSWKPQQLLSRIFPCHASEQADSNLRSVSSLCKMSAQQVIEQPKGHAVCIRISTTGNTKLNSSLDKYNSCSSVFRYEFRDVVRIR